MSGQPPGTDAERRRDQTTARIATDAPLPVAGSALVGGRYTLHELLGEGGAARVYRAQDTILGRTVAIKLLRDEYGSDPEFVARFYREARAVAALSHPNIVDIYDYGAHANTYFIAMQYIDGADLKTILGRNGRLTPEQAVAIVDGALRGLGAAHERGIIHRDVKPQNLLVRAEDGLVKLTDFGIARALGGTQVTAAGHTFGTPQYMAPEQASGGELSPATDLYAVGVVLFEALTGRLPFDGDSALQIGIQHLSTPPPLVTVFAPNVPLPLTQVVARALAKAPEERFASATAMRGALHAALTEGPPIGVAGFAAAQTTPLPVIPVGVGNGAPPAIPRRAAAAAGPRLNLLFPALGVVIVLLLVGIFALTRSLVAPTVATDPTATVGAIAIAPTPSQTPPPPTVTATLAAAPTSAPTTVPVIVPPSETAVPATETPLPATPTAQPTVPPTAPPTVPPAPTATLVPTAVPTVAPTATTRPPTATTAPPVTAPPGPGNGNGNKKLQVPGFDPAQFKGAYRRDDGKLYGLPNAALYGAGTNYNQGTFAFRATGVPDGGLQLTITGLDDERADHCRLQVVLNGTTLFDAADTFPNTPASDNGEGGRSRYWGTMTIAVPAGLLREGDNALVLRNATPGPGLGIPYILINDLEFSVGR